MFVILGPTNAPEPRLALGQTGLETPPAVARDARSFGPGGKVVLDRDCQTFPIANLGELRPGDYRVQALFDCNPDLRLANAPGNLFSVPLGLHLDPATSGVVRLELTQQLPPEQLPADTEFLKFIKIESKLLSQFYHRPIFLRTGIVLPRDYARDSRRYPLWVRIGGQNTRYTVIRASMAQGSDFRRVWQADDTPRFVLLQLDGAGPFGDPYQVNSANNGPFGDALVEELIPYVEAKFRCLAQPEARVLSGASTGGWVSLALQVFYPDFFNGVWSSCPDPVDFRAFELINVYEDDNAYVNRFGNERPSERNRQGDVVLTMRREVGVENLMGRGDCYTTSGGQWGEWNCVFSPRGPAGLPVPLWDARTGKIDRAVAEQWKKYDLRLVLEQNWPALGLKLRGKLHISVGEADQYFLNNAVHLLDRFLAQATPPFEGRISYGPGQGHGWMDVSLREMLLEMKAATERESH